MHMKHTRQLCIATLGTLLLLPATGLQAGKLYKWVDDSGQVRYGDSIPPQYAKKSNETLNTQGVIIERKAAAKTPEQLAEEHRQATASAEADRLQREQDYQDRILLDTFSNEDEMLLTRDGKIEAVEAVIRVTQGRSEKLRQRLTDLKTRAANLERAGKPMPEVLNREIAETRLQMADNITYIENRRKDQQSIRDKFAADMSRFRELKAKTASATAAAE
jgi:hypothetical protein